jgi:predicted phosphatase
MAPGNFTFEDRIQHLQAFEAEHSHLLVPQSYKTNCLGKWVNNIRLRRTKGTVKPEEVSALDNIGFIWIACWLDT